MRHSVVRLIALSSTALVPVMALPGPALASGSCNKSDDVTTCKGDVYPYENDVGPGDDDTTDRGFVFEELDKDAVNNNNSYAIQLYSLGKEGDNDGDDGQLPILILFRRSCSATATVTKMEGS
ncbi:MAG: hypothetical protein AAF206_12830 [Bacteroidota bacterium]